jgi:MFS-type transporter involved in bile tolerance (Atg22 family)
VLINKVMALFRYIREQIWPLLLTLKIEPYVFLFILSTQISEITSTQLIQDKICLFKYNRSAIYCAQINDEKPNSVGDNIKSKILSDLAQYIIYRTIIASLPSILLSLFIGSWTDKYIHGRKVLLCLVSLGYAVQFALLLWNAIEFELGIYQQIIVFIYFLQNQIIQYFFYDKIKLHCIRCKSE